MKLKFDKIYSNIIQQSNEYIKSLKNRKYISESMFGNIFKGIDSELTKGIGNSVSDVLNTSKNDIGRILKTFKDLNGNQKQGVQQMIQQALENQKSTAQVGVKADNVSNIQADKKWLIKKFPTLKDKIKDASPDVTKGLIVSTTAMLKNKTEDNNIDDDNDSDDEDDIIDKDQIDDIFEDYDDAIKEKDRQSLKLAIRKLKNTRNKLKNLFRKTKNKKHKIKFQKLFKYLQSEYAKRKSSNKNAKKEGSKTEGPLSPKKVEQLKKKVKPIKTKSASGNIIGGVLMKNEGESDDEYKERFEALKKVKPDLNSVLDPENAKKAEAVAQLAKAMGN